jgi:hypothetical protein
MVARRVYLIILILSILVGFYFYFLSPEKFSPKFLKTFSLVPFFMFIAGVHGLMAHTLNPQTKHNLISFPLVMGIVYVALFFLHLFVIMPLICP